MTITSDEFDKFDASWKRVTRLTEWTQKKQLADFLGIKGQSVSGARTRNSFPADWAYRIASAFGGSTDWIIDGRGQMRPGEGGGDRVTRLEEPVITELKLWLNEQRGEEDGIYIWFRVELQKKFPEFKEWLEKKRGAEISQQSNAA